MLLFNADTKRNESQCTMESLTNMAEGSDTVINGVVDRYIEHYGKHS